MPQFSYTATNASGEVVRGTLEADNLNAAYDSLHDLELQPTEVVETVPFALEPTTEDSPPPPPKAVDWTQEEEPSAPKVYHPLSDTLRLYAGWLLAWCAVVYVLGYYQATRDTGFNVPYVEGLYGSTIILQASLALFLFLIATSINKLFNRNLITGILLLLAAAGFYAWYILQL